ncbi:GNAT family N-acetyltransferase [Aurantiacibacter xanthus]|uniref:GNAT family N-acetyltransferase n=1 Tax=Aurantiacibacter xanthus TaxID=1784712 RepID=A0A3A1PAA1_9SPHN|nr:GNAT family N-acetyltransferase [Aurantiacibacter xanthus]RIV89913.1 GNAT family N-acetyltransferase [Aurantiacibacter xanthus]
MSCDSRTVVVDALRLPDLPAALAIQAEAYPPFLREGESAFASRIALSASYCLAARREGELLGYLLAHGWRRQSPPAVGAVLGDGGPSEVLFLHDLSVAAAGRSLAIGRKLVERAFALAAQDGLRRAELIAVEGAAGYWGKLGFVAEPVSRELAEKVRGYGEAACWMARAIGEGGAGNG